MVFAMTTDLAPEAVIERARSFFASRVPASAAFVERQSARHIVMRGQGGEEVVIAAVPAEDGSGCKVRGSSLLFCSSLKRFLATLPGAFPPARVA